MRLIKKKRYFIWRKTKDERGSVTIFLTLLVGVLLTVFLATIEIVRYEQAKGRCEHIAVGAVEHIMADYEVELANRYHIYVLDRTYLGQGEETGTHRIWNYLEQNINSTDWFGNMKGFYSFSVADVQLEPKLYVYSDGCKSLKEQIHNWFLHSMLPSYERLSRKEQKQVTKEQDVQKDRTGFAQKNRVIVCENRQEKGRILLGNTLYRGVQGGKNSIVSPNEQSGIIQCKSKKPSTGKPSTGKPSTGKPNTGKPSTGKPSTGKPSTGKPSTGKPNTGKPSTGKPSIGKPGIEEPVERDPSVIEEMLKKLDPREAMETIRRNGILSVAANTSLPLSRAKIGDGQLSSNTLKWEGNGSSLFEKAKNKIELETYIFQHFNSALFLASEEETAYQNEIEYLITGKSNDYDCLEKVSKEIVAIRTPLNYVAIKKDSKKVEQVRNVSTIICTLLEQPQAIQVVTQGILLAWSFGESVADVKCLLQGDKVPMIKEPKDWHLSFYQLFYIRHVTVKGSDEGETYEDYLKKLLLLVSEKNLYMRMLDLLELNVALQEPEFYIQNSMTKWKVDIQIEVDVRLFQLPMARKNSYHFSISKIGEYQF